MFLTGPVRYNSDIILVLQIISMIVGLVDVCACCGQLWLDPVYKDELLLIVCYLYTFDMNMILI